MSEQPPPPQVSPDGKFYWDGTHWVPLPGQQAPMQQSPMAQQRPPQVQAFPEPLPAAGAASKQGHFWRNGLIGCVGIIALIILIPFCAGAMGISTNSSNSPGTSSPAASSGPATLVVLLDKTGSGINTTKKFTAAAEWEIAWSYNCASFGGNGNFIVSVYDSDGSLSDIAVNELGAKGSDTTNENQGGTYYLEMNSECKWHVIVKG